MWRVKRLIESLVGTLRLVRPTFAANDGKFWQNYTYTSWPPKLTIMAHFKLRLNLVLPCPHPPAWYEKSGVFCGLFTNNGHLFLLLYIYLGTIFPPLYLFLWKFVGILDSLNLNREEGVEYACVVFFNESLNFTWYCLNLFLASLRGRFSWTTKSAALIYLHCVSLSSCSFRYLIQHYINLNNNITKRRTHSCPLNYKYILFPIWCRAIISICSSSLLKICYISAENYVSLNSCSSDCYYFSSLLCKINKLRVLIALRSHFNFAPKNSANFMFFLKSVL